MRGDICTNLWNCYNRIIIWRLQLNWNFWRNLKYEGKKIKR